MAAKSPSPAAQTPVIVDPASRRGMMHAVWRPCCWGIGAAVAITLVVLAGQTETGSQQLQIAFAQANEPEQPQAVAVVPPRVVVDEAASRRLADAVRTLTADRDRLNSRLASLERSFNDMTGSIKTVMQANAAAQSVKAPKQAEPEKTLAPAISAPTASTPAVVSPPLPQAASVPAATPAEPLPAEQQAQEFVPLPPVRVASAAASDPANEPQAPAKIEYGIDLGSAVSVDAVRGEWLKAKANYGPLLTGLRPVASPRQRASGGSDYRLVVGPFASATAAGRMCAKFNAARIACRTAKFTGEDLAPR